MIAEMMIRPVEGPWILRPVKGPWILWPVEGPQIQRPAGGPWLQQSVCCHDYFGLVTKNRLLWPLEKNRKKNCSGYKQTTKQDNKEINKQAIHASLLPLLHILHPLGIKVRHQCKYREKAAYCIHWPSKLATSANKRGSKTRA